MDIHIPEPLEQDFFNLIEHARMDIDIEECSDTEVELMNLLDSLIDKYQDKIEQ